MFDGIVEMRTPSSNLVIITRCEYRKSLKLKATSKRARNFSCLSQHEEGTLSSSLLWHARYEHINYNCLRLLKENGVSEVPTSPKKLKQCDACIVGKHTKKPFHESNL